MSACPDSSEGMDPRCNPTIRVAVTKDIIVLTIHSDRCIPTRTEARPSVRNQVEIDPYSLNYCIMEKLIINPLSS